MSLPNKSNRQIYPSNAQVLFIAIHFYDSNLLVLFIVKKFNGTFFMAKNFLAIKNIGRFDWLKPKGNLRRCMHRMCNLWLRVCMQKAFWDVREMCVECGSFLGVRCAIALLHTFWNKQARKSYLFVLKNILANLILIRTFYPVLEPPKNCWKKVNLQKVCVRVQSATTLNWRCAHVCVRT